MEKENQSKLQLVTAWMPVARTILLYGLGSMIAIQQTFIASVTSPYLLTFAGALLGLPLAMKLDKAIKALDED